MSPSPRGRWQRLTSAGLPLLLVLSVTFSSVIGALADLSSLPLGPLWLLAILSAGTVGLYLFTTSRIRIRRSATSYGSTPYDRFLDITDPQLHGLVSRLAIEQQEFDRILDRRAS